MITNIFFFLSVHGYQNWLGYHGYHYLFAMFQMAVLQSKLRESKNSSEDHHTVLRSELARRDDSIQKLRRDLLQSQESRDAFQAEVSVTDER